MLQTRTEETQAKVKAVLDKEGTSYWFPDHNEGVHIDDYISYDEMAAIVDAIREEEENYRKRAIKARLLAIREGFGTKIINDTIKLSCYDKEQIEHLIDQLGDIGYDVDELTKEYIEKGRITI